MDGAAITIAPGDPHSAGVAPLLAAHSALLASLFPAESNYHLDADALSAPDIRFVLATHEGHPVGCVALALRDGYGEVKSMYIDPAARGTGLAARLMAALEEIARAESLPLICLETGDTLLAAQKVYERAGFTYRGPFGDYPDDPLSRFMEKRL